MGKELKNINDHKADVYEDLIDVLIKWRDEVENLGNECAYTDDMLREAEKMLQELMVIE